MVHNQEFLKKAQDVLGQGTQQFMSSVLTLVNSDKNFKQCDPIKLYNCCLMAAAIKLPFNQNLGQAYVIAYKGEPQELRGYATKYSQSFKFGSGVWKDNFDEMAKKTVLKRILSKYAPLSIDMQKAIKIDQSDGDKSYPDAPKKTLNVETFDAEEAEVVDE